MMSLVTSLIVVPLAICPVWDVRVSQHIFICGHSVVGGMITAVVGR